MGCRDVIQYRAIYKRTNVCSEEIGLVVKGSLHERDKVTAWRGRRSNVKVAITTYWRSCRQFSPSQPVLATLPLGLADTHLGFVCVSLVFATWNFVYLQHVTFHRVPRWSLPEPHCPLGPGTGAQHLCRQPTLSCQGHHFLNHTCSAPHYWLTDWRNQQFHVTEILLRISLRFRSLFSASLIMPLSKPKRRIYITYLAFPCPHASAPVLASSDQWHVCLGLPMRSCAQIITYHNPMLK